MDMALSGIDHKASAQKVATGLVSSHGNGMQTAATATRGPMKAHTMASAAAATSGSSSSSTSATNEGDITSNDFLTLLVTEMQNQDPTQPTDPNAYIQQLVSVNSLQQLISINGELGGSATGSGSGASGQVAAPLSGVQGS